MEILKPALAGTLESNDAQVKVEPRAEGLEVVITSEVMQRFGGQIRKVVAETLARMDLARGLVVVEDKGALDCTLRARVQAAVLRGCAAERPDWGKL